MSNDYRWRWKVIDIPQRRVFGEYKLVFLGSGITVGAAWYRMLEIMWGAHAAGLISFGVVMFVFAIQAWSLRVVKKRLDAERKRITEKMNAMVGPELTAEESAAYDIVLAEMVRDHDGKN